MDKYINQMKNVKYNIETKRSYSKKKGSVYHSYCNDILTFDIETTSAWLENGKVKGYEKGHDNDYWNELQPLSLCYIWQFSFNDKVYFGRRIEEFENVLRDLPKDLNIVIWVHNLSFEFQFLTNFLKWKSVFARSPHKPMKCVPEKYPNIEFRCSYMLTRLSLEAWGKQLGVHKAVGNLDYEKIRTPLTELTKDELYYCEQDCIVVYHGIKDYLSKYKTIRDIPLTQTGTVRRVCKELLMSDKEYSKYIKRLVPKSAEEYKMLMEIFSGGFTHANRIYSGKVIKGTIQHYDFASSYPTVMVAEKYPSTVWLYQFDRTFPTESDIDKYAYILKVRFTNLDCQTCNTYIQASKMIHCENTVLDNGRVISADMLEMYMTELDYLTIKETYKWEKAEILTKYRSEKRYLPKAFVDYILDLYLNKTTLKDVEGMEDLYMQSKQYINSLFGMMVTAIVQPNVIYNADESTWKIQELTDVYVEEKLGKLSNTKFANEKRYFLSYSWGCWVTAYARRNLWKCIIPNDEDVIYCDTDSIFVRGEKDFSWYNKEITEKLKTACEVQELDFLKTRPKTRKGKEKPLGIFDKEDDCIEFITLGAKRYVERRKSDGKLHLTVSGINKEAVALLNNDIRNFKDEFNFDKDADCVHKQLCTYCDDMPNVLFEDGFLSTYKHGINLRRTGYLLTIADDYKKLINYLEMGIEELDDHALSRLFNTFRTERKE